MLTSNKENGPALSLSNGFTLLEVIVAIFVVSVGIGGVLAFLQQTVFSFSIPSNQLVASYLAQEGVEIVRNIRDTNYVRIARGGGGNWDDGLGGCPGDEYQGDYLDATLQCFNGGSLNRSGNSYVHGSGTPTLFARKITVAPQGSGPDWFAINVEVSWTEKGKTHSFVVDSELYNWTGFE